MVLGLPFDASAKRRAWRGESRRIFEQTEAQLWATRNDVRAEAREAYAQTVVAERAQILAEETAATARELFERVKARLAANAATGRAQAKAFAGEIARVDKSLESLLGIGGLW